MTTARFVIRADSGLRIGNGHVMRALTLADALRAAGSKATFVSRSHANHIISEISARGHEVEVLAGGHDSAYGTHPAPPRHAGWLGGDWREDALATRAIVMAEGADWVIMDHYALDRNWQEIAVPAGVRLLVLDDLADRPHLAHVLLDQNAGRIATDYDGLVPDRCDLRIGPAHALLRPDFARLRPQALRHRETLTRPRRLLVSLGGVDKNNATDRVLDALDGLDHMHGAEISVILGVNAPWLDTVRARAARMSVPTEVADGVSDMAERMATADLCIGAAGSTAWERCALGLPTLQVVLAENQQDAARHMSETGVALALPPPEMPGFGAALEQGLIQLSDTKTYRRMARATAALTDGGGTERLVARLLEDSDAD